jgi:integrase
MGVKVREKVKGSKVYWLFIDHNGKRKAKRVGDKRAAELAAIKIQAKLADGDASVFAPPAPAISTLGEYAERWMQDVAALRCQPSTIEQYRNRLRTRLLPNLGKLPLTAITRERVKALVAAEYHSGSRRGKDQPLSPDTVDAFSADADGHSDVSRG